MMSIQQYNSFFLMITFEVWISTALLRLNGYRCDKKVAMEGDRTQRVIIHQVVDSVVCHLPLYYTHTYI